MLEAVFFQWCLVKSAQGTEKITFFTPLKIPELQSVLVCKMPFGLVAWQESRNQVHSRSRTAGTERK